MSSAFSLPVSLVSRLYYATSCILQPHPQLDIAMNPYDTRPSRTSGDEESQRLMTKHEDYFPESLPKKQTGQVITTQRVYVALLHGIVLVLIALLWSRGSEHPARSQTDGLSWCKCFFGGT